MTELPQANSATTPAIDPVCKMRVERATARHRHNNGGDPYYFFSPRCHDKFAAEPQRYLAAPPAAAEEAAAAGIIFTCPMHPQIRQRGPGTCPICGMALEPEAAGAEEVPNPELADMTRRFWIALIL